SVVLSIPYSGTLCPSEDAFSSPHSLCSLATDFQEEISFKIIHSSSFYNHSWVKSRHSGWLGDLQTHGWDTNSGSFIFLRPWSKGNLSKKEIKELQEFNHALFIELRIELQRRASQWQLKCKFNSQN
uniref:MHC class I-like antigen recognition-like domain-containing protein n=1 Tax=Myotis lucifugus TaxID=59463 RepID=G1Q1L6_MYOLU